MKDETLRKVIMLVDSADEVELRSISDAVHSRVLELRRRARREAVRNISVGDRVKLVHIKPKYLEGTLATVESRRGSKFVVVLDDNCDSRALARFGRRPVAPANTLEKVDG